MGAKKYRNYFQINESYFPAVNEDVIKTQPDVWKQYYPHESFIKLLNQTKSVLTNAQKLSIWVEGAYGTGKSHAVLTLQKILECSNEELKEYFDRYKNVFKNDDLYNEFYNIKNQTKKVLTVHRYGSSDVRNDKTLMEYVQESIIAALEKNGFSYKGQLGIKQAMINWLSEANNRSYFNNIIQSPEYKLRFSGDTADAILEKLKTFASESAVQDLIEKISTLGEEKGIRPFVLKKEDLKDWILDVIDKNNLKAIFFIWDEFSDYFSINKGNLSGFQYLAELSETNPFYFVIVTHKSDIFFENSKDDVKTKINGRFIAPHCSIELPDHMAFVLTGHAMEKVNDKSIRSEWDETIETLYDFTHDSREQVKKAAKIDDQTLKNVLPIHPYAALVLKHIASAFDSNQRSMFDFIKNDRGDDIKGFQWFIDNYGPEDDEALLTVDLLWDFFYEKGKDQLAPQIRSILDVYSRTESHNLMKTHKRVLKTLLLLQAINEKVGDAVSLFVPNDKNIGLAFEGTEISSGNAASIAKSLVKEQIIFERPMGGGQTKYSALVSNGNLEEITKEKERLLRELRTDKLIEEGEFINDFKLPKSLEVRFVGMKLSTHENIRMDIAKFKNDSDLHPDRLYAIYTFARNEDESNHIRSEIQKTLDEGFNKIVFIDYSNTYLSNDNLNQYIDNMANCNYQKGKDMQQSKTFYFNAKEALRKWKILLQNSTPKVFAETDKNGTICNSNSEIFSYLREFNKTFFPYALEANVTVIDTMFMSQALKQGAECGITGDIKGTFKSTNENTKLEKQFSGVWNLDNYWKIKPNELLSRAKIAVENLISEKLEKDTRVSIGDIYGILTEEPFGYMPCNITAFVMGFLLREYSSDKYNWSDDLTNVPMSVDKMKEMIEEIIKQQQTPSSKYRTKYIVAMSQEQRIFNKLTAHVFGIDESLCSSIENTRSRIRLEMTNLKFPIWVLKYECFVTSTNKESLNKAIDLYVELANNTDASRSETDIALDLGRLFIENDKLADDLKSIFTKDNCIKGMQKYLIEYKEGKLINLAKAINDPGTFVDEIAQKFSEASNWVWNKDTVNEKIDETIIEYEIVNLSANYIVKTSNYSNCLAEWSKKISSLKVSYLSVKQFTDNISELLGILYQIRKNGYIYDTDKESFKTYLENQSNEIKSFLENQMEYVRKIGGSDLEGLEFEDISSIAKKNLDDVYTLENSEYISKLQNAVKQYKADMLKFRLLSLWKEKTNTENPFDWSESFKMPILCMIPPNEQDTARNMFSVMLANNVEKSRLEDAITYFKSFKYYSSLSNKNDRDDNFRYNFLKNYSLMIDDLDSIKEFIKNQTSVKPYNWIGNQAVEIAVKDYATNKYKESGNVKVSSIIDSMSSEDLKKYLKDLVKDNIIVGIEIMKNKSGK